MHVHAPVVVREAEEVLSLSPPRVSPPSGAVSANSSDVIFSRSPNASTRVGSLGVGDRRSNAERTHRSSRTKNADGRAGDQRTATTFPGVTPSHRRTAADDDDRVQRRRTVLPAARNARGNVGLKCKDTTGDTPPPPTPAPASRKSRGTNDLGGGGRRTSRRGGRDRRRARRKIQSPRPALETSPRLSPARARESPRSAAAAAVRNVTRGRDESNARSES